MMKQLRRHRLAIALAFGCAAQPFAAGAINSAQIIASAFSPSAWNTKSLVFATGCFVRPWAAL